MMVVLEMKENIGRSARNRSRILLATQTTLPFRNELQHKNVLETSEMVAQRTQLNTKIIKNSASIENTLRRI